jgi:RimJ/RimL family protein N-acetyltransferase
MASSVFLRPASDPDLDEFFIHSRDRSPASPEDHSAFIARWRKYLDDSSFTIRTITVAEQVVGYIGHFTRDGVPEVSYELGPKYWGNGYATSALRSFVAEIKSRPLYARVVKDNTRSIRVLQKCGYSAVGEDRFSSGERGEAEEFIFALNGE